MAHGSRLNARSTEWPHSIVDSGGEDDGWMPERAKRAARPVAGNIGNTVVQQHG